MASLIKDVYSPAFYNEFAAVLQEQLPSFSIKRYLKLIFTDEFAQMEWKERMMHSTTVLHQFLPAPFADASQYIINIVEVLKASKYNAFPYLFLPDYIARFGLDDFKASIRALEATTQFISCEFAVRPFLLKYQQKMLQQMIKWSKHPHHAVRRLASEGARPRLPWAMALPGYKQDPTPLLPLLENLRDDPHEWVRLSVANHLNDISKDHPHVLITVAEKWMGNSKLTDAIIKHASRTLLKKGHPEILKLFRLNDQGLEVKNFSILTPEVTMGENLLFRFKVKNSLPDPVLTRLEYGMYFLRSNGTQSKKVFKISERYLQPGEEILIQRKQSFKPITTRVYYPGPHQVSVIVNGTEKITKKFRLR